MCMHGGVGVPNAAARKQEEHAGAGCNPWRTSALPVCARVRRARMCQTALKQGRV